MAVPEQNLIALDHAVMELRASLDDDPDRVMALTLAMALEVFGSETPELSGYTEAAVLLNVAGNLIDSAARASNSEALAIGEDWTMRVLQSEHLGDTERETIALYNLAN